ncbi:hypothetical protein M514_03723 [Trichuris suis]|uniref:Uncharacterized protein n=1 Tax=Trichuris suis TaxID=68888 RepID=A0A085NGW0_9BILA|nr:hypothetical protein M514_03723 [Trichuris suis]KHJ42620.1 7 transmembrane receptor [Trichuris suis]
MSTGTVDCFENRTEASSFSVKAFISQCVIPIAFAIGIIGNTLNLLVLNCKKMRCKTSYYLSAMAVADLGFFITMTIFHLSNFPVITASASFNKFYAHSKMTLTALANWFSTTSTWLAIAVTCERLVATTKPLHVKILEQKRRIITLIVAIYASSLPLFSYTFIWHSPIEVNVTRCNITRTVWNMREISQAEHPWLHNFVHISLKLVPNISTTIPLLALIVLNALLLYSLSEWRRECSKMVSSANNQRSPEIRVALTVAITIASFLLFQTPSGILYLWDAINGSRNRSNWFYTATYASNLLVIIGKTLNFIIYCASSKNFRKQLLLLLISSDDTTKRQYFYAKCLGIDQTTKLFPDKVLPGKSELTKGTTKYGIVKVMQIDEEKIS